MQKPLIQEYSVEKVIDVGYLDLSRVTDQVEIPITKRPNSAPVSVSPPHLTLPFLTRRSRKVQLQRARQIETPRLRFLARPLLLPLGRPRNVITLLLRHSVGFRAHILLRCAVLFGTGFGFAGRHLVVICGGALRRRGGGWLSRRHGGGIAGHC